MKSAAPAQLLAKSEHFVHGRLSLEQHLGDTERAVCAIFDPSKRVRENYLRFFRVDERDRESVVLSLRVAGLFHDIGKANEDFFNMVTKRTQDPQTLRHEHISGLVLSLPSVRAWLAHNPAIDYDAVCAAVLSHHLKVSLDATNEHKWCQPNGSRVVALWLQHPEIARTLERIASIAELPSPPALPTQPWSGKASEWGKAYAAGRASAIACSFSRTERAQRERARLLAVKAGVIAADGVASAMFREGQSIESWVESVLHSERLTSAEVWEKIITPRLRSIESKKGSPVGWHAFQVGVDDLGPRALLLAACGAGKTLAAWRWIASQCETRNVGRVLFLYPTRGTSTEGFRDYVGWAPEAEAMLLHGSSAYELTAMRDNESDATKSKTYTSEAQARLFALGLWSKRFFSATVDQFLGFMEHAYESMCLLPALADAVVVLDEVHSYDKRLFENTVSFLHAFDVPVLAMTATLPQGRKEKLVESGLEVYPRAEHATLLQDLAAKQDHPRYKLCRVANAQMALPRAVEAYREGKRVLWVVNTVARAQQLADALESELGCEVICYHSRYKLEDRKRAHECVVKRFQESSGASIAVATQVAEMSLDLDADVLVTEVAPVPSLVQRMGRANRDHLRRGAEFRAEVIVYSPEKHVPYARNEIELAEKALEGLGARDVSQSQLAALVEQASASESVRNNAGAFLTSGWFAVPHALRDIDEFTVQCVLERDVAAVQAALESRQEINGFLVPVPKRDALDAPAEVGKWPRWLSLAASEFYSTTRGYRVLRGE